MMTFLLAPISQTFHLTGSQTGVLGSSSLAGMAIGAALAGMLADRFGRKSVFQVSMIVWGAAACFCAGSWNYESLLVGRFFLGLGMGAEFPVAQSMLSELIPAASRGRYIALLEGFWPLGFILAGCVALIVLPLAGWRGVFLATGIPAIYVLVIRRRLPESPRWYEAQGDLVRAEQTMCQIESNVCDAYGQALPEPKSDGVADEIGDKRYSWRELLSAAYRHRTFMVWTLWFFALLGYYGITTWMGKLLVDNGFAVTKSIEWILLMTLWGVPGFISAAFLIEKLGRKVTVSGYMLLSAASAYFYGHAASFTGLIITGAFMQFFFFGMWSVLYAYTPELFPTRARATGCGTASTFGRIGALIGPMLVPVILEHSNTSAVFTFGAGSFVIAALAVLNFGIETRGKILEEINR